MPNINSVSEAIAERSISDGALELAQSRLGAADNRVRAASCGLLHRRPSGGMSPRLEEPPSNPRGVLDTKISEYTLKQKIKKNQRKVSKKI